MRRAGPGSPLQLPGCCDQESAERWQRDEPGSIPPAVLTENVGFSGTSISCQHAGTRKARENFPASSQRPRCRAKQFQCKPCADEPSRRRQSQTASSFSAAYWGSCRKISTAMVPCPSTTSVSLYGEMYGRPDCSASRRAVCSASNASPLTALHAGLQRFDSASSERVNMLGDEYFNPYSKLLSKCCHSQSVLPFEAAQYRATWWRGNESNLFVPHAT